MNPRLIKKFAERFAIDEDKIVDTLKATAFRIRDGVVTDAQMMALLIVADQYGLNPFTREIYAFPDKQNGIVPVVGVDGWSRIINQHPEFDGMEFRAAEAFVDLPGARPCPEWMECVLYRKDRAHPTPIREYLDEVYREPFTGHKDGRTYTVPGPWQTHTKRFLRHKTMIQAARLVFGFVGIYDPDEAERILDAQSEILPSGTAVVPFTGTEPSDEARRMVKRLIDRAQKAGGAWQAALDYAAGHFDGSDLAYVSGEIRKVQNALPGTADPAETAVSADPTATRRTPKDPIAAAA